MGGRSVLTIENRLQRPDLSKVVGSAAWWLLAITALAQLVMLLDSRSSPLRCARPGPQCYPTVMGRPPY